MSIEIVAPERLETKTSDLLEALAWEVELAGARCIFLDALIGEFIPAVDMDRRERLVEGLHAVDLLSQHLTGLSAFVRRLAVAGPGEALDLTPALSEITLGDLANRLRATLGGGEDADERAEAGALDLF
ncbi:hypothetical protein ACO2Q3_00970 [Caulobacter sp. KR2-114]|uniref:hypothetical protein n=1 Tax=Caulobacter sp. KR2-114 TaxID=3400912 RepID=UPI003C0DDF25